MTKTTYCRRFLLVCCCLFAWSSAAHARIFIEFRYTYDTQNNFPPGGPARALFTKAATDITSMLELNTLDAITPGGGNTWLAKLKHPETGVMVDLPNLTVPADTMIIYPGVGIGGALFSVGGRTNINGSVSFTNTVWRRGRAGAPETAAAPWGGSLRIDPALMTQFFFDPDPDTIGLPSHTQMPGPAQIDFYSFLIHELSHCFGLGGLGANGVPKEPYDQSNAFWWGRVNKTASTFTGPTTGLVALEPSDLHWADNTLSTRYGSGLPAYAALTSSLPAGQRRYLTTLDLAGYTDWGWTVAPPNQPPVLAATSGALTYIAIGTPQAVDPELALTDPDSPNLAGASVSITANLNSSQDTLEFSNQNGITGSYNTATGVLTLSGASTVANYRSALRSVAYRNNSNAPAVTSRTVQFTVDDGLITASASRAITLLIVGLPPTVTASPGNAVYTKFAPPTVIDPGLIVADPDSVNLAGATVQFTAGFDLADELRFTPQSGISGSFATATARLTLTGISSVANYQTVLRSVAYWQNSSQPSMHRRIVTFTVSDSATTGSASRQIDLIEINKAPTLDPIAAPAPVAEDAATQTIILTGIGAGAGESQNLTLTATSDNPELIPAPAVSYTSPNTTGSLSYTPVAERSGTAHITVTLKDSGGTAGGGIDTTTRIVTVTVLPVNDPPTVATSASTLLYTATELALTIDVDLALADIDDTELESATVSVSDGFEPLGDLLEFEPVDGLAGAYDAGTGVLTLTGTAPLAAYGQALRSVTFHSAAADPIPGLRTLTFAVTDGDDTTTAQRLIRVVPINQAPTLDAVPDPSAIFEDAGVQALQLTGITAGGGHIQTLSVTARSSDPSVIPHPTVAYTSPETIATLNFAPAPDVFGSATITLTVRDDGGTTAGGVDTTTRTFTITVQPVNDAPLFTQLSALAAEEDSGLQTVANWAAGISPGPNEPGQNLAFIVENDNPALFASAPALAPDGTLTFAGALNQHGSATVTVRLRDDGGTLDGGADTSAVSSFLLTLTPVNDPPTVTASPGSAEFVEAAAAVAVDPLLGLGDVDTTTLSSARVSIIAGLQPGADVLGYVPQPGITGGYDAAAGVLTLSGDATLDTYQELLRAVTFRNTSENPSTLARTLLFEVNDGAGNGSASRAVSVTAVNDAPQLTATAATLVYNANAPAVALDGGITAADPDSTTFTEGNVAIAEGFEPGKDSLAFADQSGISGSYAPAQGILTLSGTATVAAYQAALRSVTFASSSQNSAAALRLVTITVSDGTAAASATRQIQLNFPPVLELAKAPMSYTLLAPPTRVDPTLRLSDPDSGSLVSASVRITLGFDAVDVLGFAPRPGITGSYSDATGRLTLTGNASVADYETLLRSVTFWQNTSQPSRHRRVVEFNVNDGIAASTATREVRMIDRNLGPTLDPIADPAPLLEDSAGHLIVLTGISAGGGHDQVLSVSAVSDNPALLPHLAVAYVSPGTTATLEFAPAPNVNGTATVTVTVKDDGGTAQGGADSVTRSFSVTVLPVNDAPSFVAGPAPGVPQGAGSQTYSGWAQPIQPGPANESGQIVAFLLSHDTPGLFAVPPALASDGTLTFTPVRGVRGSSLVTVRLQDDGGLADGGIDTSAEQAFTITVGLITDADADGMPDDWEVYFGLNPGDASDAAGDAEGDSWLNLREFQAGTSPIDPADFPAITSTVPNGDNVLVAFRTVAGKRYRVERNMESPSTPAWATIADDIPGTGEIIQISDLDAAVSSANFYRVVVVP